MAITIQEKPGQFKVIFDHGTFDEWCVYLFKKNTDKYAPTDSEYFSKLKLLGLKHGINKIYGDFVSFYILTCSSIDNRVLNLISDLSSSYGEDQEEIEIWFTVIYAGMVAEENKAYSVLKKRIKRLGLHQALIENLDANFSANFSKGKNWRELDTIMKAKGF